MTACLEGLDHESIHDILAEEKCWRLEFCRGLVNLRGIGRLRFVMRMRGVRVEVMVLRADDVMDKLDENVPDLRSSSRVYV